MSVIVRTAIRADAWAIARVRVDAWRVAYRGLIADAVLDGMDAEREGRVRTDRWSERMADNRNRQFVAVDGDEIVGWAAVGPGTDDDRPGSGELHAMYALPGVWSRGVGHALMCAAEQALREAGFVTAHLWVLDGNERAASFYERHGWHEDGAEKVDTGFVADSLHERRRVREL
ncbi:GNAT family N-acetyltransferase [Gordonia amarae]|uniref:N-acetyltransferase domain-containing protein n=2 Tax=Gordonia amarae TaxID=36821 RepID=G7GM84_9ACTN|nr:GNAT family N-acetyltransferase [Gordonia amarae]MCS3881056.1 GNAT superfamily N-acetyltransferase [Gordonia amarae]QHN19283.1 GNAT family N-acetyltransferase [Gordonia amarae]QHN23759.1 GNAT family N-acetyltransferase [Gordonia amarae]QHN32671.1 GNAT family N-acetyltransferase [Gordonia amarae]QHN41419.1 GNAT family N-acetyltransferase [Gordonia amarae]